MSRRVVVTGMGTINPLGHNVAETWQAILDNRSGVDQITHFDPSNLRTHFAAEVKGFDPVARFGRKDARQTDRVAQFALAAAEEAVQSAGLTVNADNRERIGVVLGSGIGGIGAVVENTAIAAERGVNRVSPFFIPQLLPDTAPALIAIRHDMRGPNMAIATACASATNAIGEAARMIRDGSADIVLAGGCEAAIYELIMAGFGNMGALSTRNDAPQTNPRPFSHDRDGFVMGEGAAILVLEARDHAVAREAPIRAELRGYGASADAFHISAPHEHGVGAITTMRLALAEAGLAPADIDYINAHGTGTSLNDKIETEAIKTVFGDAAYNIPVSSTKSYHGHLLGAAGGLEAIVSIMALENDVIPATRNYTGPAPGLDLDYVTDGTRRAPVRTVLSNNFGFGGHNATIILAVDS